MFLNGRWLGSDQKVGVLTKYSRPEGLSVSRADYRTYLVYVWRSAEWGNLSGFFFLVLLMIIKLDFKRFNMLFLDSCQPSQFFLYNFLKIENLSRFQIKQLRKWTLNNRVLRASTRTKCVFNKTEVSHLFHTISLVPVMQSRSAM